MIDVIKKISAFAFVCLWFISATNASAQSFAQVGEGIEYAEMSRVIDEKNVNFNLLKLDLTKVRLEAVHAKDSAIGLETVSSMAKRYGAFAAINAGFFRLDNSIYAGDPAGVLQIDKKLLSESFNDRIALGIINGKDKTEISIGHLKAYGIIGFGIDSEFAFSGINRERKSDEIILYTSDFNRSTLTDPSGREIILSNCSLGDLSAKCLKTEISERKGSSIIPPDGYVISIGKNALEKSNISHYYLKKSLSEPNNFENFLRFLVVSEHPGSSKHTFFSKAEDIVGGVPQLIKNGKIDITWEKEKSSHSFLETRHPRTAVAKLKDGKFLMITADGRSEESAGVSLQSLAEILLEHGATEAMNLDGGGSTTMFLDGKVVNKPSDKSGERRVSDAILIFPRQK